MNKKRGLYSSIRDEAFFLAWGRKDDDDDYGLFFLVLCFIWHTHASTHIRIHTRTHTSTVCRRYRERVWSVRCSTNQSMYGVLREGEIPPEWRVFFKYKIYAQNVVMLPDASRCASSSSGGPLVYMSIFIGFLRSLLRGEKGIPSLYCAASSSQVLKKRQQKKQELVSHCALYLIISAFHFLQLSSPPYIHPLLDDTG